MSGIAGIIYPDQQAPPLIKGILKSLHHRGPHIEDSYSFHQLQIGCIGRKVHFDEGKNLALVLDGTIYNLPELENKLNKPLKNSADAILAAYERWSNKSFEQLEGNFSFALFDQRKETLYLVRDPIGIKPLYWAQQREHLLFASELKALLSVGIIPQVPSPDGIAAYLHLGYIPQDISPIVHINKLPPGNYLRAHMRGEIGVHPYWSLDDLSSDPSSHEEIEHLLIQSLQRRIPSEKKIACFLSGDTGSTITAQSLKKLSPSRLTGFTTTFQNQNEEDLEAAIATARSLDIPHHHSTVTPKDLLHTLVKIQWALDEPYADPNAISFWQLSQMVQKTDSFLVSSVGFKELFSNTTPNKITNPYFHLSQWVTPLLKHLPRPLALSLLKKTHPYPKYSNYLESSALFSKEMLSQIAPQFSSLFNPDLFLNKYHQMDHLPPSSTSQYFNIKTLLPDQRLLQYDRITSAHHLDWHSPFLDSSFVKKVFSLSIKMEESPASLLPPVDSSLNRREKSSTRNFLNIWGYQKEMSSLFHILPRGSLVEAGILSSHHIQKLTNTPNQIMRFFPQLWALLTLEVWYRLYIHRPHPEKEPTQTVMELFSKEI